VGNGAIGPFLGAVPDLSSNLAKEAQNIQTIRDYYDRAYRVEDPQAFSTFLTAQAKVHRDGEVLVGRANLAAQITNTISIHRPINVSIQEVVAFGARVTYRMIVEYSRAGGGGVRERRRGIAHSRLSGGRIAETWVHYEAPEPV
jgi:hypothetical protein